MQGSCLVSTRLVKLFSHESCLELEHGLKVRGSLRGWWNLPNYGSCLKF